MSNQGRGEKPGGGSMSKVPVATTNERGSEMTNDDSTLLLDEPEIRLQEGHLVLSGWRFKLDEIQSSVVKREATAATGPILMTTIGAICLVSVASSGKMLHAALGIGLLVSAAIWWTQKKPFYRVCMSMTSGEATAFESPDEQVAEKVSGVINEACAGS